jgi:hypothetical protein
VTRDGSRIAFQLPFGKPSVVFEGEKFTATIKGPNIVDYCETGSLTPPSLGHSVRQKTSNKTHRPVTVQS